MRVDDFVRVEGLQEELLAKENSETRYVWCHMADDYVGGDDPRSWSTACKAELGASY